MLEYFSSAVVVLSVNAFRRPSRLVLSFLILALFLASASVPSVIHVLYSKSLDLPICLLCSSVLLGDHL